MKKIAVIQSNYIPWKGYFDIINSVDEFILYDDVQYTKNDWRNRNRIKTQQGLQWLTIPIKTSGHFMQLIRDCEVANHQWARKHWRAITMNYKKANYFEMYEPTFERIYTLSNEMQYLSRINLKFITTICEVLNISTPISWSTDYSLVQEEPNRRLIELCKKANADCYISGPAAKDYIQDELWQESGIDLKYFSYDGYPEYEQLYGEFNHYVSVLDLLFNTGPEANTHMISFQS